MLHQVMDVDGHDYECTRLLELISKHLDVYNAVYSEHHAEQLELWVYEVLDMVRQWGAFSGIELVEDSVTRLPSLHGTTRPLPEVVWQALRLARAVRKIWLKPDAKYNDRDDTPEGQSPSASNEEETCQLRQSLSEPFMCCVQNDMPFSGLDTGCLQDQNMSYTLDVRKTATNPIQGPSTSSMSQTLTFTKPNTSRLPMSRQHRHVCHKLSHSAWTPSETDFGDYETAMGQIVAMWDVVNGMRLSSREVMSSLQHILAFSQKNYRRICRITDEMVKFVGWEEFGAEMERIVALERSIKKLLLSSRELMWSAQYSWTLSQEHYDLTSKLTKEFISSFLQSGGCVVGLANLKALVAEMISSSHKVMRPAKKTMDLAKEDHRLLSKIMVELSDMVLLFTKSNK